MKSHLICRYVDKMGELNLQVKLIVPRLDCKKGTHLPFENVYASVPSTEGTIVCHSLIDQ